MKKKTLNKKKFVAKKTPKVIEASVDAATRWLNMTDVCLMLQVTRTTISKYIKEKGLPAYKVGKAWNFKKHEIDRWLRQFLPRIH